MHASAVMLNNDSPLLRPVIGWLVKRHWIHVCNLLDLLQYFLTHVRARLCACMGACVLLRECVVGDFYSTSY
jgi:hypothetical protein